MIDSLLTGVLRPLLLIYIGLRLDQIDHRVQNTPPEVDLAAASQPVPGTAS